MTLLGQPARNVARYWHPHIELVVEALDAAPEMRAPQHTFAGIITNRFKRYRNFNRITVAGQHSLRLEHNVEAKVFISSSIPRAVCLYAKRVEIKLVGFALVVESIEQDADVIIVKDVVSLGNIYAHLVRLVVAMERNIKKSLIIPKDDFRRL